MAAFRNANANKNMNKNKRSIGGQSQILRLLLLVVAICGVFVHKEFQLIHDIDREGAVLTLATTSGTKSLLLEADAESELPSQLPSKTQLKEFQKQLKQLRLNEGSTKTGRIKIPRLINDPTLDWNETMHRPWLSVSMPIDNQSNQSNKIPPHNNRNPPYMILLTNVGWNHPDKAHSLEFQRFLRERELFQAIVNHPYFHPTAWEDIRNGIMPISDSINYYVFVDVMQCIELNYPYYGTHDKANLDTLHNRSTENYHVKFDHCWRRNKYDFWKHPLCQRTDEADNNNNNNKSTRGNATIVLLNCSGGGPWCDKVHDLPMSVASMGGVFANINIHKDQGLIPAAPNPIHLSPAEKASIANCNADADPRKRPLTAMYVGNFRNGQNNEFNKAHHGGARTAYRSFHNPQDGFFFTEAKHLRKPESQTFSIHLDTGDDDYNNSTTIHTLRNASYSSLLRSTKFALVPRGDDKFSYRFTEALGAGAIPVYHGDDHMLPFRPELVDWNRCGLVLPEKDAGPVTIDLLKKLVADPNATQNLCAMRQYCYFEIYEKYVATTTKQINGLIEGLEALARGERKMI